MIKMTMSDKNKVLLNSPRGASPNVKSALELRYNYTSLLATNRNSFNCVTFQINPSSNDLRAGLAVFFFLNRSADCGQITGPFEGIYRKNSRKRECVGGEVGGSEMMKAGLVKREN